MTQLTYRGVQYTPVTEEITDRADVMLYYRGAAYNPAKQEVQPETAATLIYRGAEYERPAANQLARTRAAAQKKARVAAARAAFVRNMSAADVA